MSYWRSKIDDVFASFLGGLGDMLPLLQIAFFRNILIDPVAIAHAGFYNALVGLSKLLHVAADGPVRNAENR